MAIESVTSGSWSAGVTLAKSTVYQCRTGQVRMATGAGVPADEDDGIVLSAGEALQLDAGVTVYWKRHTTSVGRLASMEVEP